MSPAVQEHHFFKTWDGSDLYCQSRVLKQAHGVLIVIHGMADHSGRYQFLSDYFSRRGWALYLMDQRGQGRSPGPRCHADRFNDLVDDLQAFVRHVQSIEKKIPLFLVAHSFGAQVAVNYLARQPKELKGAVLSSPNLKLAMKVGGLKKTFAYAVSRLLPTFGLGDDIHADWISHDPEVVRAYEQDKLICHRISLRLGVEILNNLSGIMNLAAKIKLPCLIVHGEADQITSLEGSRKFYDRITFQDKTMKTYPGFYHEIFNEIGKERVFADVEAWLEARVRH